MTHKRKAPADTPSTIKDPDYAKKQRAKAKAEKERFDELCGPVTVLTNVVPLELVLGPGPNAWGYTIEVGEAVKDGTDGDEPRGGSDEGQRD